MSEFTDATITADEFSEEVLKYPRNIGVDGALTSEWKNQNILGDFEVRHLGIISRYYMGETNRGLSRLTAANCGLANFSHDSAYERR